MFWAKGADGIRHAYALSKKATKPFLLFRPFHSVLAVVRMHVLDPSGIGTRGIFPEVQVPNLGVYSSPETRSPSRKPVRQQVTRPQKNSLEFWIDRTSDFGL